MCLKQIKSEKGKVLLGSYYTYWIYYTYCSDFWGIVLFIFITTLLFLLYVRSGKKVDHTVDFYFVFDSWLMTYDLRLFYHLWFPKPHTLISYSQYFHIENWVQNMLNMFKLVDCGQIKSIFRNYYQQKMIKFPLIFW